MKHVYIVLLDEIKCVVDGLTKRENNTLHEALKIYVEGYRHTALFQIGKWDGKKSHYDKHGHTFIFMLPKIFPLLKNLGYEWDIIYVEEKTYNTIPDIDNNYLKDTTGIVLRDWQVESINLSTKKKKGLISAATSAGKSIWCAIFCKLQEEYNNFRTLTIVPSENLVDQTYDEYLSIGLDVGKNHGKILKKKKEENFKKQHVISTWQSLSNQKDKLDGFQAIIYDEAHVIGDVMFDLLANELSNAQVRIGLTATIPKTKWKRESLCCHIGDDEIYKIKTKDLQEKGHVSSLSVTMIPIVHNLNLPDNEWETEFAYLNKNKHRIKVLIDFINKASGKTLILVQAELGNKIKDKIDIDFIDKDVKSSVRKTLYKKFKEESNYKLLATYGTVGTGISINEIENLILVDAGKNETRILQGIGRGLRLDGKKNHLEVFDLYSELYRKNPKTGQLDIYGYSSNEHLKQRKRIYKREKYPFIKGKEIYVTS